MLCEHTLTDDVGVTMVCRQAGTVEILVDVSETVTEALRPATRHDRYCEAHAPLHAPARV